MTPTVLLDLKKALLLHAYASNTVQAEGLCALAREDAIRQRK